MHRLALAHYKLGYLDHHRHRQFRRLLPILQNLLYRYFQDYLHFLVPLHFQNFLDSLRSQHYQQFHLGHPGRLLRQGRQHLQLQCMMAL